jgi:hypothetical protein
VHHLPLPFTLAGRKYGHGTAFVRIAENQAPALEQFGRLAAAAAGVEVVPIDTAWVDEGLSLGSSDAAALKNPRVLLAWDTPTSTLSAGWARYVLERRFHVAVTAVRVSSLGRIELPSFDVIVLPSGSYAHAFSDDQVRRLREWLRAGGTLVTIAEASRWATSDKVDLLETHTELRDGKPEVEGGDKEKDKKGPDASKPFELEKAIQPERERPENTPGAVVRVALDLEHWLASGQDGEIAAIVEGQRVFTPITLDKGRNVGLYATKDRLVAGGLVWDNARDALAQKAFLIEQSVGRGHLVAFAEDPDYRAFTEATELLLANAVLLGSGY